MLYIITSFIVRLVPLPFMNFIPAIINPAIPSSERIIPNTRFPYYRFCERYNFNKIRSIGKEKRYKVVVILNRKKEHKEHNGPLSTQRRACLPVGRFFVFLSVLSAPGFWLKNDPYRIYRILEMISLYTINHKSGNHKNKKTSSLILGTRYKKKNLN